MNTHHNDPLSLPTLNAHYWADGTPTPEVIERRAKLEYECRNADAFRVTLDEWFMRLFVGAIALLVLCFAVEMGREMQANNRQLDEVVNAIEGRVGTPMP